MNEIEKVERKLQEELDAKMSEEQIDKSIENIDIAINAMEAASKELEKMLSDTKEAELKGLSFFEKIRYHIEWWYRIDLYSFYRKIKRLTI